MQIAKQNIIWYHTFFQQTHWGHFYKVGKWEGLYDGNFRIKPAKKRTTWGIFAPLWILISLFIQFGFTQVDKSYLFGTGFAMDCCDFHNIIITKSSGGQWHISGVLMKGNMIIQLISILDAN